MSSAQQEQEQQQQQQQQQQQRDPSSLFLYFAKGVLVFSSSLNSHACFAVDFSNDFLELKRHQISKRRKKGI